jgi:hypothetical protein
MASVLKSYGPEGPPGFPLTDEQARNLEAILKRLPTLPDRFPPFLSPSAISVSPLGDPLLLLAPAKHGKCLISGADAADHA